MKKPIISQSALTEFENCLCREEKSSLTIQKYVHDTKKFAMYLGEGPLTKECVIAYKQHLLHQGYEVRSVNSMLASVNAFFRFLGKNDLQVKTCKLQKQVFCAEERELTRAEYYRLCAAAESKGQERIGLILQTICSTGIRVSELSYFTVEAVKKGTVTVQCKGKTRVIFMVKGLQKKLLRYAAEQGIKKGAVFVTRTGKTMSRTNVWRGMKELCEAADVNPEKVYPHNLRHLFARLFYENEKDIAKLADVLGHSSINTTRIYIVSTGQEHRRQMEKMHLIL